MAIRLAIVEYEGKHWFLDNRLRELRAIDNPHERVSFDELEREKMVLIEARRKFR